HRTTTWPWYWPRRVSDPGTCGPPGLSISSPAWTPSSFAKPSAWTPPGSCATRPTRSKTPGSQTCELQASPCTRRLEPVRFAGVVDRGLGSERFAELVVLLDLGVLVIHVQARGDALGDDAGTEPPRCRVLASALDAAPEAEAHVVGPANVEVVADQLLEEDPPAHRGVEHLGEGELGLQDRQLIAVPGGGVVRGERVRQDARPSGGQRLDLGRVQAVADRLHRGHVIDGGECVVQRHEADAGLGGLPLGVLVAVDDQPTGIREVAGELHAHRPELLIDAVKVVLVHDR